MSKENKSTIVLTLDGLRSSALGPYGNTWFDTPNLNRLAAESDLFEQCIADAPAEKSQLDSILTGSHHLNRNSERDNLMDVVGDAGLDTILVTSDSGVLSDQVHDRFDQVLEVELNDPTQLASSIESTQLATFFAEAIAIIEKINTPTLLWLHCNSLTTSWDAPYQMRLDLCDEEDPEPPKIVEPPVLEFNAASDDPDQLLGYQQAYGAQVSLLDKFLGVLIECIDTTSWCSSSSFYLSSLRGYPMGEHGVVGFYRPLLNYELSHVPLVSRDFRRDRFSRRIQRLVQTPILYDLIATGLGLNDGGTDPFNMDITSNDVAVSVCRSEESNYESIQTYGWKFIRNGKTQLFVRPDDRWEVNEVSGLCPQIANELNDVLSKAIVRIESGENPLDSPLPDHLAFGIE